MGVVGVALGPERLEQTKAARERFPVDKAPGTRGEEIVQFRRIAKHQIDSKSHRRGFRVQSVFKQGLDFRGFEKLWEGVATR